VLTLHAPPIGEYCNILHRHLELFVDIVTYNRVTKGGATESDHLRGISIPIRVLRNMAFQA
jgi:hypothetical protein